MGYDEIDMASFCGKCRQEYEVDKMKCPGCGNLLVNFNTKEEDRRTALERWKRLNNQ
jgi:hypothetical protein